MNILFLDDDETRWRIFRKENPDVNATWFFSYKDAVAFISKHNPTYDIAYLDHDLWMNEPTGMDFANYLVDKQVKISKIFCHSMNPNGRMNMVTKLHNNGYDVFNFPFAWQYKLNDVLLQTR